MGRTTAVEGIYSIEQKKSILYEKIKILEHTNSQLLAEKQELDQRIYSLEEKMRKIGDAEEQRDWLLDELTKKIAMIGEIRSDLLKTERLSAIGELSSRLAHDMRNPLSIILNTMDLVKMKYAAELSPEIMKLFLMIDKATSRMTFQLDEVLNFVRHSPLEFEQKSLLEIIDSSLSRVLIPDQVKISKPTEDVSISCDSRKLEAVFSNLVMNAIQAMKNNGNIQIGIFEEQNKVTIEVQDSGPGIPRDILPKVFEPLFTTKSRGTGLGLATVKHMVEQHHGSIKVKLDPTTFCVTLPKSNR